METIKQKIQKFLEPQKQLNPEELKNSDPQSYELAKSIFWTYANARSIKELQNGFIIDDENRNALAAYVAYFTGNKKVMEQYGMDPRKGIIIFGNPGSGKSKLFRIILDCLKSEKMVKSGKIFIPERLLFEKIHLYTCEEMGKLYMEKGESGLFKVGKGAIYSHKDIIHCHHACFDDLGAEEIKINFGNRKEIMVDVITERYDLFLEYGLKSHFTTNLTAQDIENRYSSRIRSRLKQMCNVMELGTEENYLDRR